MLVLLLIGTVIVLWVWSWGYRYKDEPPLCSGSKPLIGNALQYAGVSVQLWDNIKTVNKEALERGGVLKTTIGPRVIYVVSDPEDLTTVANACLEKDFVYKLGKRWFGDGLVTSSATAFGVDFSLSGLKIKQDEYVKILHNISNTNLRQRKESLGDEKEKDSKVKTFMDLLLELSLDTNVFTDQEVREHVDTFIVTGYETSATVLVYCILLIGSYPRVQEKIHDELRNVFDDEDRDITKHDLAQLVYLEAVIKESMRLYPIGPVIGRYLHKDIKLRKTYGMMSLKVTMAHFCRNYMVHGDDTKLTLKLDVLLKPFSGHHIAIEKKN